MTNKKQNKKTEKKILVGTASEEKVSTRGRTFRGTVIRKFQKRVTIEFDRTLYIQKFERYLKKSTRIHARLPEAMTNEINIGDFIEVQECRPLSKIIHFMVIKNLNKNKAVEIFKPQTGEQRETSSSSIKKVRSGGEK